MHGIWDYVAGGHAEVVKSGWGMLSLPRVSPAAGNVSSRGGPLTKGQSCEWVSSGAKGANPGKKAPEDQALGECADIIIYGLL